MIGTKAANTLERRGKTITTFVIYDAAILMEEMKEGELLEVVTDAFEPFRPDIAAWCDSVGHRLVDTHTSPSEYRFLIEKGTPQPSSSRLAMVISNPGLEELLSPLGFALAAALEGVEVHIFFQGPAVRVLKKGYRPKLPGWGRPFSRFAAAGMAEAGHIPAQDKLRQLTRLGAQVYLCGPSMQQFKVASDELILPDLPQIEYLSFMALIRQANIHIYS